MIRFESCDFFFICTIRITGMDSLISTVLIFDTKKLAQ
jgi:hypothetical protein